ncbi:unnamed protein product [Urochloa humidicola]
MPAAHVRSGGSWSTGRDSSACPSPPPPPTSSRFGQSLMTEIGHFSKDMKELIQEKVFIIDVLGYISYNF